jgi:copper(I)-binding protein
VALVERRKANAWAAGIRWTAVLSAAGLALTGCGAGNRAATSEMGTAISGINVDVGDLAMRDLRVDFGQRGVYLEGQAAPLRVWIDNQGEEPIVLEAVESPVAEVVTLATEVILVEETPTDASATPTADASETPEGEDESPEGEESESPDADDATPTADGTSSPTADAESPDGGDAATQLLGEPEFAIEIKPGEYVQLVPARGSFLLLEGLTEEVSLGSTIEVTFFFSNGEEVTVDLPVGEPTELASRSYFGDPEEGAHAE